MLFKFIVAQQLCAQQFTLHFIKYKKHEAKILLLNQMEFVDRTRVICIQIGNDDRCANDGTFSFSV